MLKSILTSILVLLSSSIIAQDWIESLKVLPINRQYAAVFSSSVSIDGDYMVIGALGNNEYDSDSVLLEACGGAFVFHKSSLGEWEQIQKLVASDKKAGDYFGGGVVIYGNTIAVGAPMHGYDEDGSNFVDEAGAIYIYEPDSNEVWVEIQKIVGSNRQELDRLGGVYGKDLAMNENYLVGGCEYHDLDENDENDLTNAGIVFVFEKSIDNEWVEVQKLVNSDRNDNDGFGRDVAIHGSLISVGAINQDYDENGEFYLSSAGAVYIFERDLISEDWTEIQKVVANERTHTGRFGYNVDMDSSHLIIGAIGENLDNNGGSSSPNAGAAYIFERNAVNEFINEVKISAYDRLDHDRFGHAVAIENNVAIVTSFNGLDESGQNYINDAGSAYVYSLDSISWSIQQKLISSNRHTNDNYGYSLSLNNNSILIASPSHDYGNDQFDYLESAGAAYLYELCDSESSIDIVECNYYISPSGDIYTESGQYIDTVLNADDCLDIITINLMIDTVDTSVSQSGVELTANATNAEYQWITCAGFEIGGATEQSFTPLVNGYYAVIVDQNSCIDTSSCYAVTGVGIEDLTHANEIKIYPNPFDNLLFIEISEYIKLSSASFEIVNILGETVVNLTALNNTFNELNTSGLSKGIYFINIILNESKITLKIVKS